MLNFLIILVRIKKLSYHNLEWVWFLKLRNPVLKLFSIVTLVLSILIILGELTLATDIPFSLFGIILKNDPSFLVTEVRYRYH